MGIDQRRRLNRVEHGWCRENKAHIVIECGASDRDIGEGARGIDGNGLGGARSACAADHGIGGRVDLQDRSGTILARVYPPARAVRRVHRAHPDGRAGRIHGNGHGSGCRADRDGRDDGIGRDVDDRNRILVRICNKEAIPLRRFDQIAGVCTNGNGEQKLESVAVKHRNGRSAPERDIEQ